MLVGVESEDIKACAEAGVGLGEAETGWKLDTL